MPLIDAVVGNAGEADLAARPGLNAGPFDALIEVARFAWREVIDETGRAARAAGVDTHAGVTIGHPLLRPDAGGRYTSARRTRPSSMGIGTSHSIRISSRSSLPGDPIRPPS